ncbi:type VI secretion system Vgr family protein [Klebsiella pasteurii]|uniref:type VI secretion system Vgr family protein n=1 Tax=Klebsiella pasteurii TaxID=2587529 RepID=UPI00292AB156|nr:type VI secretion system tip protein VgrG [Klebsiella pasteurii]MDV1069382.1 type VI secretion system tip protein VgrG [Klebsiella pasteurii]MDV1075387.1 type VI secretion system tip protein VgrG [Klebsiella pasteurii]
MSDAKSLMFSHSHNLLKVRGCKSLLDVLCFEGHEALSKPFNYTIEFTSTDKAVTPQQMLMQDASLTLVAPVDQGYGIKVQQPVRTLQGVVTGFERLSTSKDETHYSLTLQPRLALLSRSHQNRIYQDMSVPDIVEHILRTRHDMRGEDFVFTLANEYPRREQVMQYGEDDMAFISRLLAEVGIWYKITADTRLNIDVVEFYDDQRYFEQGVSLPSVPPSGQHDSGRESVWALESHHNVVEQSVFTRDYNYRNAPEDMNLSVDVSRGDSTTYGEAYHWADNYLTPGNSDQRDPEPESGAFYARIRHERYLNRQTLLNGETNCVTMAPGQELKVTGGEEVTDTFRQGVVITGIHSRARRDRSFEVTFHAIPYSEDYCFRPEPGDKPKMAGTLPARVTSTKTNDIYGHIDRDGRYKVNLLFDRDHWQSGEESLWVRQSRPYAGDTYGLHLPLLAGTEVAIAFEQGDPDRPYIAGVLHDSAHGDHVTIYNYKRNVLRTPANNKIRLDDTRGKEHIKVSTEYGGKSQLNLGHLVDQEKKQRGEGFELRTDSYGTIRAGKGIFITADEQPKAQGQQLAMEPASSLLKGAQNLVAGWERVTQTHHNLPPDADTLKQFVEKADQLKKPVLLMEAPDGIGTVTPESILLHSGNGLYMQSIGEVSIASEQRLSVNASQAISLLSRQEGVRLVSAKGPLNIESHGDILSLTALQDVTIQSTQGHLQLTAKNGITIGCGGAYIRLTPQGEIEIHGPGLLSLKGQHNLQGPASEDFQLPDLPSSVCKECIKRAQELAQGFVPRDA